MDTINEEVRSEIEQIASGKLGTKDHLSSVSPAKGNDSCNCCTRPCKG
jgi:hypothetical protein